jgi:hypothetical protein
MIGWEEGIEFNAIGLSFGVNPKRLALKLPFIGNLGDRTNAKPRRIELRAPSGQAN